MKLRTEEIEEIISLEDASPKKNVYSAQQRLNMCKFDVENIRFMDISSNKKWLCYVSQSELSDEDEEISSTLNLRKFTALNDETQIEEEFAGLEDSRIEMEDGLTPILLSIPINNYIDTFGEKDYFLSISLDGQFIALSSYYEESKHTIGGCVVFMVHNHAITFQCELDCNGRAVFLNRADELCLAFVNMESLRIYNNIHTFSNNLRYDEYDMKSLMPTCTAPGNLMTDWELRKGAMKGFLWQPQRDYTAVACTGNIISSSHRSGSNPKWEFIAAISAYIKDNLLLTPPLLEDDKIRLWSLKLDGVRLASISAPDNAVIAISDDVRYAATTTLDFVYQKTFLVNHGDNYTISIFNLENGCLVYTLKSHIPLEMITHATFCCNSRYIALTGLNEMQHELPETEIEAVFQVWHIESETLIYSVTKKTGQFAKLDLAYPDTTNLMKPSIFEDKISNRLKGLYFHSDRGGDHVTIKFFYLNLDCQKSDIKWLIQDDLLLQKDIDSNKHKFDPAKAPRAPLVFPMAKDEEPESELNKYFQLLRSKFSALTWRFRFEIGDPFNFRRLKSGYFKVGNDTLLLSCGCHLVQLWRLVEGPVSESTLMRDHQLVYIRPYSNSDYRSFYLSPNIWSIESFESLKVIGGPQNPRLTVKIVEDYRFLEAGKNNLTVCDQDIILPVNCNSKKFDSDTFEGACQALYFLNIDCIQNVSAPQEYKNRRESLLTKCDLLISNEINKLDGKCAFFQTINGSKTLAMLASFKRGRGVLRLLLKNKQVAFSASEYQVITTHGKRTINLAEESRYQRAKYYDKGDYLPDKDQSAEFMTESVLTVLIREREYQLYHLVFNRILSDSVKVGPEGLFVLNEALLLLQSLRNNEHYQRSCQKLSYVPIGDNVLLPSEKHLDVPYKAIQQEDLLSNIGDVFVFSAMEQLPRLEYQRISQKFECYTASYILKPWHAMKKMWGSITNHFTSSEKIPEHQLVTCVVPLPHFNTYYRTTVREAHLSFINAKSKSVEQERLPYKKKSLCMLLSLDQSSEPNTWKQGDDVMVILLQHKWKTFIRHRFYFIFALHIVYYVTYCVGIQFALEVFAYDITNVESSVSANSHHLVCVIIYLISATALLLLEINQIPKSLKFLSYFKNGYNHVDILAIVFPFINFLQLILGSNQYFFEICSVSTLILWLHGIIRLRVFSSFGIALEIVIQLFKKVFHVFLILLLVIFGFTHSFIVLLRQQPDQYFQENYGGDVTLSNNSESKGETSLYDLSSSNGFSDPFKAFYQVWLFIFGVWDPVTAGDAGDNRMLFILCMLFAFITVLIFTNMIIALMSSTVEEVKQHGKKVWMTHFAAVIAEIESLSVITSKRAKYDRKNNPAFTFYSANYEKVKIQEELLRQDTLELRRNLMIDDDEQAKAMDEIKSDMKRSLEMIAHLKQELAFKDREVKASSSSIPTL